MQSTQMPKTSKETDPHDIFEIEQVLAAHANRAPPLVHDPVAQPAAPQVPGVPEISVGMPSSQVDATFHPSAASELKDVRPGELKAPGDSSAGTWTKGVLMAVLGLGGAVAAAAWQHYGDQAKAMAIGWAPPSVIAAMTPSEKLAAAEQESAPVVQAAVDQAAAQSATPAAPAETATPAAQAAVAAPVASAPSNDVAQLQSDLAAMTQQVEELKASIAQLKASQAQLIRDAAAKASEAKPAEQNLRPKVTAAAAPPPPRPAVAPVRKPKPAYPPAQAAYIPPPPPAVAPQAVVPPLPAPPPQAVADDGQPVVRPPMPLR